MKYIYIVLIWSAYCALHSYLISIKFTTLMKRLLKKYFAFYRLFYVVVSVLLLIPIFNITNKLDSETIINYSPEINILRNILIAGSLIMFSWAFFFNYDILSFFGIRQAFTFKKEEGQSAGTVKKKGLLGIVRHPMYLALLIFIWCRVFTLADIFINIVLTVYIYIGTRLEENKLILEFGNDYLRYQDEVPMLIPFLKRN